MSLWIICLVCMPSNFFLEVKSIMSSRINGIVKWFSNNRGYGFLLKDGVSDNGEYFCHFSSIIMEGYKTLKAGQNVTFEIKDTDKGKQATNVMLAEGEEMPEGPSEDMTEEE